MKRCAVAIGAMSSVVAAPLAFAQVRVETVLPRTTDPAIDGWLGAHAAVFDPSGSPRGLLLVYLHGQGGTGTGSLELLRTAAEEGLHAVGLTYPNDWSPFNLCGGDPACPEALRREILDGADRTPVISVSRVNSVENRLLKLLAHLHAAHPAEGWNDFVAQGDVRWDRVLVWGHSQGGGNAGVLARVHALARACTSAPAADGGQGNPAAWWAQHATPASAYYGFCHTQDALANKIAYWDAVGLNAFGTVVDVAGGTPPYSGTHKLSSSVEPAIAGQYHNSVISDAVTPRDGGGVPVYKPVWRYMLTTGLPARPCGRADVAGLGGSAGADGALTADDIAFYLSRFFASDAAVADLVGLGGSTGRDGAVTVDDLVAFLAAFFAGCA